MPSRGRVPGAPVARNAELKMRSQFVMEDRFGDINQLPTPNDTRIMPQRVEGGFWCAMSFSGW